MCAFIKGFPKKILIIDDDLDLLMLLERNLLKEGYEVETAANLPEAEEIYTSFIPHLVLLDINVNGEDGRQLCWKIKMNVPNPEVKVLVISGYDFNLSRAALFGADDLVSKPFQVDYLLHKLEVHLLQGSLKD